MHALRWRDNGEYTGVLIGVLVSVKRHHDQGNSYKEQHLIGAGLQFQRFSPLALWQEHGTVQAGMVL